LKNSGFRSIGMSLVELLKFCAVEQAKRPLSREQLNIAGL
jgi:hypothetical protein